MTAQLSRERLEEIKEFGLARIIKPINDDEILALIDIALTGMDSEPVVRPTHEATSLQVEEAIARMEGEDDMVQVPRGLLGAALGAIRHPQHSAGVTIGSLRHYAYQKKPAPVAVPDFDEWSRKCDLQVALCDREFREKAKYIWNACRAAMLKAGPVTAATVPEGWTANADANDALIMLERIDTVDCDDDERIESVKNIIRRLAAAPVFGSFRENENSSTNYFRENSETSTKRSREHFISLCNRFWNWQEFDQINAGDEEPRLEWNGKEFTHRVTQALWRMYQAAPEQEV